MNRDSHFYRSLHIIRLGLFAEIHIHRVGSSGNVESRSPTEILLKFLCVQSSWHYNQLQIWPLDQYLFYETEKNVSIKCPLMSLVENHDWVLFEFMVHHGFSEQHTVSHIFKDCFFGSQIFESDRVSDLLSKLYIHLFADPLGDGHGGHSSRLSACDPLTPAC